MLDGFAVSLLLLVVVAGALLLPATAWEPAVAALAAVVAAIAAVLWALSSSLLPFSQQVWLSQVEYLNQGATELLHLSPWVGTSVL